MEHIREASKYIKKEKQMESEKMKEYLKSGHNLFYVEGVSTFRDGGTTVIGTSQGTFCIHKSKGTLHIGYPNKDNIVTNPLMFEYLSERIQDLVSHLEWQTKKANEIIEHLGKLNKN